MKFLILILFFLQSLNSQAFTLISSSITGGWDESTLNFNINETSCTALGISSTHLYSAIDAAIELWNKSPTSKLKIARGSIVTSTTSTNPPTIYCSNTSQSDGVAGVGTVSTSGGIPALGSLYLNADNTKSAYFENLTSAQQTMVVAHEIGHVLGLGHSEKQYALMYYDLSSKTTLNLSQDDMDGLSWLNPKDELKNGPMGCATIEDINTLPPGDGNSSVIVNWFIFLMIAFVASRRRNGSNAYPG